MVISVRKTPSDLPRTFLKTLDKLFYQRGDTVVQVMSPTTSRSVIDLFSRSNEYCITSKQACLFEQLLQILFGRLILKLNYES